MRLINTRTLQLEEFNEANRPPYAILSHTWENDEVTFQQMQDDVSQHSSKAGYQKIARTCKVALSSNLKYAWVDTCCINKTSSAELSEAINSMFRWYEDAEICYAYLSDVYDPSHGEIAVVKSRWFTRGWTLQELIAPRRLVFYNWNWNRIDFRSNLSKAISRATGIDERLLQDDRAKSGPILRSSSIAQRMSWASRRQTTRTEDLAYCLLGLFDINMPLLYGEGIKAFTRLQEEIIRHTDDQSIFAWGLRRGMIENFEFDKRTSVLAPSPAAFSASGDIVQVDTGEESAPFSLTNRGIRIDLCVKWIEGHPYGIIPCRPNKATYLLMIKLGELHRNRFFRANYAPVAWTSHLEWKRTPKIPVYLMTVPPPEKYQIPPGSFLLKPLPRGISVRSVSKGYNWSPATGLITMDEPEDRFGRETMFRLVLEPINYGSLLQAKRLTVSVWVRRPSRHLKEHEWVTYDVRYFSIEGQLRKNSQPFGSFFAKVEKQAVFGQRLIVIEVFSWEQQGKMSNLLQRARIRLERLLDKCIFGVLGARGAWLIILLLELMQEAILYKPVLILATVIILWPVQDFQLESWVIEGMRDIISSHFEAKSTVYGALYLLAFWLKFPIFNFLHPVLEVLFWVMLWPYLSTLTIRMLLWTITVGVLSISHYRTYARRSGERGY
ncbi:HET domain-containing protein [Fusarium sp. LHS14.1]|nr:HET domain-containing protein [Fusarium sp. LHS14.1]